MSELIGLELKGKVLPPVPPNAGMQQQIAAINDIIATLNNVNKDIVASDIASIVSDGSAQTVIAFPHNLGYKPRAFAYLNDVNINIGGTPYLDIDLTLPTYVSSAISGGVVQFLIYIDYFVDNENIYFHVINGAGSAFTLTAKYFLTREASN